MKILSRREHPGLATLYLADMADGKHRCVEFVDTLEPGVSKESKWVMMVSTQVGCPVGCRMCDAGALGYQGNLSAEEILFQVRHIVEANPQLDLRRHPKVKIHLARMGEPSLNPGTLGALMLLAREFPYPGILPSLSTVAPRTPVVDQFFEELLRVKDDLFGGGRFQLQFSLHSTDEEKRRQIVPIRKWSLEQVAEYGKRFVRPRDRKITLNFALGPKEELDADLLSRIFPIEKFLIKITPVNPTDAADRNGFTHLWEKPPDSIRICAEKLRFHGFEVILSPSLPQEIASSTSCGQLWSDSLKAEAGVFTGNKEKEHAAYVTFRNLKAKSELWLSSLSEYEKHRMSLEASRSALLVIDMQEFFLDSHSPAYLPQARTVLRNVQRLVEGFRGAGRPVFFVRHAHEDPGRDGGLMTFWWKKVCLEGTPWADVCPLLNPHPEEVFRKCRYSAFSNPALPEALHRKGIQELVAAGIVTNLCVESSVRDAFDLGFKTFVVADATAAHTEELHLAALKSLAFGFSSVCSAEEVLEHLLRPCLREAGNGN